MIVTYQPVLVLLSIGVAILGSLTALALTSTSQQGDAGHRSFALANGGLIMGATIWSMHFVAMMAVEFPLLVNYNLAETIGSICIAIVATGAGLYIASTYKFGVLSIPVGGLLMGLGIGGMHYLGMGAIRGCGLAYNLRLVAASVGIAIGASMAALWFTFYKRGVLMTLAGGVVQGLAIASMHYTAMAATYFVPLGVAVEISEPIFSQSSLAYLIAAAIAVISVGNLAVLASIKKEAMTHEQIHRVQVTFGKIAPFAPLAAEVFYRRLFEIAPGMRQLFPGDLTDQSAKFVAMLSIAVANLHKLDEIEPAVRDLGRRHVGYGATEFDYEPMGDALMWTLEQALREEFTPEARAAWQAAYDALAGAMMAGARKVKPAGRSSVAPIFRRRAA
jgi:NO-binding membrane sensor protein with MHYT domain/hemoglobin-like flavoprotein